MKSYFGLSIIIIAVILAGCAGGNESAQDDLRPGRYVGYSWRGEAGGTAREDASQYIQTVLEIDEDATIAIVDLITRYQMEMKIPAGADLSIPMSEVTIGNGAMVPIHS
ncbi:MAG: hypothetical protein WD492_02765 [Alkalispirochaeta sp.]